MTNSVDMLLQILAVSIILIGCLVWIVRKILTARRRSKSHQHCPASGCAGCPLVDECHSTKSHKSCCH